MEKGDLVKLNCFKNGKDEAIGISDEIEKLKKIFLQQYGNSCQSDISNKRI